MLCYRMSVSHLFTGYSVVVVVTDRFFFIWETKKWSLVASDRQPSYTVTVAWEFALVNSVLVVLDEWSSYRGGCLNRFDCTRFSQLNYTKPTHKLSSCKCRVSVGGPYLWNEYLTKRKKKEIELSSSFGLGVKSKLLLSNNELSYF